MKLAPKYTGNLNHKYTYVFISLMIILVILTELENIKINAIVFMTLKRGIITQNCFWWRLNDFFRDSTGYETYINLKQRGRFVKLNVLGKPIYLLTSIDDIKEMLDSSPDPFAAGILKKNFFSTFMTRNVGISDGDEWVRRRKYNDIVLETDHVHYLLSTFSEYIKEKLHDLKPNNFSTFSEATRQITSKIIFGTYKYNDIIFKIFKQADSILSATLGVNYIDQNDLLIYENYLKKQMHNPRPNCLLYFGNKHHTTLPEKDIIEQIPHWIFPIAGLFSVHLPRLLVLLLNHPSEYDIVKNEILNKRYLIKDNYIRKCILELFRLNNAVNSTFRGLIEPYSFSNTNVTFAAGTEFVFFNNPLLRDLFEHPNQFVPSRWNLKLENEYIALMFNQGNQRCPGKELTISLLQASCVSFLEMCNFNLKTNIQLNTKHIPYLINPCTIEFSF